MVPSYPSMMDSSAWTIGLGSSPGQIELTWTLIVCDLIEPFDASLPLLILFFPAYFAFDGEPNDSPIATGVGLDAGGTWPSSACNSWGPGINTRYVVTFIAGP